MINKTRTTNIIVKVNSRQQDTEYIPPTFLTEERSLKVVQGEDIIIECMATGNPPPTLFWQRKGKFELLYRIY